MAESFECKNSREGCNGEVEEQKGMSMGDVEKVDRFCYLGDTINSGGGCEIAVSRRCRLGWKTFNELVSILAGRRLIMRIKGKNYKVCVRAVMVYGSET